MMVPQKYIEAMTKNIKNRYVYSIFEIGSKYIFVMKSEHGVSFDPYYSIDKETMEIEQWNPLSNLEAYREAMKKPLLYKRESK